MFALAIAIGVVLATPATGHTQGDPTAVARALIDAENRQDVEAAVALFAPDAVVVHASGTLTTTAEILGDIRFHEVCADDLMVGEAHVAVRPVPHVGPSVGCRIQWGTPAEFAEKSNWGHCTIEYALRVAMEAGARRLCVFHDDPSRTDDDLDTLIVAARRLLGGATKEILAAAEGMVLTVKAGVPT